MGALVRLVVATVFLAILSLVVLWNHPDEPFLETLSLYLSAPLEMHAIPGLVFFWGVLILALVVPSYFTIAGFFVFVLPIWILIGFVFTGLGSMV
ncbi:MAG: hypothetical protein AAF957_05465 [Planctomycetota bacterium]